MAYPQGQLEDDEEYATNALKGYRAPLQNFAFFYPWELTEWPVYMCQSWHFLSARLQAVWN